MYSPGPLHMAMYLEQLKLVATLEISGCRNLLRVWLKAVIVVCIQA